MGQVRASGRFVLREVSDGRRWFLLFGDRIPSFVGEYTKSDKMMESAFATVKSRRYSLHHIPDRNNLFTMKFAVILAFLIAGASAFGT
jgi:hypothetical protein